jgi:Flp pilus assembly protein TadG
MLLRAIRRRGNAGQATVEFALTVGLVLLLFLAIVDIARLVATHAAVITASREAARYGSAIGDNGSGTERYRDCTGIREAARRTTGALVTLADGDIVVSYDHGPSTGTHATCPVGSPPAATDIASLDRVNVRVTATYQAISPLRLVLGPMTVASTDRRTIAKAP